MTEDKWEKLQKQVKKIAKRKCIKCGKPLGLRVQGVYYPATGKEEFWHWDCSCL